MPKSQLAGGSAEEIAAEPSSPLSTDDSDLDGTPDESPEDTETETPGAAGEVSDVTDEDEEPDEADAEMPVGPTDQDSAESDAEASDAPAVDDPGEPFKFKADGKEFDLPGAVRFAEGVYIPTDSLRHLQEHLADRRGLNGRIRQLEQKLENADPSRNEEILKARAVNAHWKALMDQGPEAVAEFLDGLERNRPILEERIRREAAEKRLELYTNRETTTHTEQEATALASQMDATLQEHLDVALGDPEIAALGLDRNRLQVRLYRQAEQLFTEAPAGYEHLGIKAGDLAINLELLRAEVNDAAELARTYKAQVAQKEDAKKTNRPAVNASKAPPVVAGSKQAGARPGTRTSPKSREEWEEGHLAGAFDAE